MTNNQTTKEEKPRAAAAEKFKRELAEKMAGELEVKVKERTVQLDASNQQLKASNQQLNAANQQLGAAQKNLQDKLLELERFNKITMGREMKILELKEEVARLKATK